ncbi:MAG TPA: ABC transporter ATP-binding protein [Candidatus Scybalousia intestinigallinarum]|jgi:hypothetical protein|nr:ABC transporter ATP-binding protein [Candidatus Scybalousia intestinigallinarum]
MNAIEIKGLVKKYDEKFQLGKLDLTVPKGVIVGLIGENGAGKTTLLKAILNIIQTDEGTIKINGRDNHEEKTKENIGVVLDNMFFPELLTAKDIELAMRGIAKNWDTELYYNYLKEFSLPVDKPLKALSKGMRKKLEIATALSHHPDILILDEATSGLDPVIRNEILDIFLNFIQDENHTIILSTHITSDLEHVADKIVFIDQGKIVLDKDREELIDHYGILKCDPDKMDQVKKEDYICYKKNKYDVEFLVADRDKMRKKYSDFVVDKMTLEELMLLMIKGVK